MKILVELRELFQKNHDEIVEINRQIKKLKDTEEIIKKQQLEQYEVANIFEKNNEILKTEEEQKSISTIENEKNIFIRFVERLKQIFVKNKDI